MQLIADGCLVLVHVQKWWQNFGHSLIKLRPFHIVQSPNTWFGLFAIWSSIQWRGNNDKYWLIKNPQSWICLFIRVPKWWGIWLKFPCIIIIWCHFMITLCNIFLEQKLLEEIGKDASTTIYCEDIPLHHRFDQKLHLHKLKSDRLKLKAEVCTKMGQLVW